MKKANILYGGLFFIFFSLLASCGYEPEVQRAGARPDLNTIQVLDARGYSILNEAIAHAGLEEALTSGDSTTLFAPTDQAFLNLLNALGVSSITDVPAETVADILSYHVVAAPVFSNELPRKTQSLNNHTLYFSTAGGANVNGTALVVEADMVSNISVIHGINKVLDVPVGNLLQQIQANDSLAVLASAIQAAGIESLFTGATEYTVFTPTNAAFAGVDINALTADQLINILGFHVLPGVNFSQELPVSGRIASIQGNTVDDNVQEISKVESRLNGASIIGTNTVADNGVYHMVGSLIRKVATRFELLSSATNATGNDTFGFDSFGNVVAGSGYTGLDRLADTLSIYAPLFGPTYGDFASNEEAIQYIENHLFDGRVNLWTIPNGTKVTAISGRSYYMVRSTAVSSFTHTGRRNAFGTGSTFLYDLYNTRAALPNGVLAPLPEDNLLEVLQANANYELFTAIALKVGSRALLESGEATVFAVTNAIITARTGFTTSAEIEALDEEDDQELLEALAEIVGDHVVESVNFARHLVNVLPTLETLSGNEMTLVLENNVLVIGFNRAFPEENFSVNVIGTDMAAANGVVHEVDDVIAL